MKLEKRVEKFTSYDLGALRMELLQSELEPMQARELLSAFLKGRGYGADRDLLEESLVRLDDGNCEAEQMQKELERVALVM